MYLVVTVVSVTPYIAWGECCVAAGREGRIGGGMSSVISLVRLTELSFCRKGPVELQLWDCEIVRF